jgi:hypothetical protein
VPVLTRQISSCFVKVEAVEGTDAVPAATDAIQLIEHGTLAFGQEIQNPQPDLQNQLLDEAFPVAPAAKWMEFTGKIWVRGLGSAYGGAAVPELHAVLQAMGLSATFNATKWDYDTASTGTKSVTLYLFRGTDTGVFVKYPILGARVSKAIFRFPAGKPVELEFTLRGLFVQPADAAAIAPTYQTTVPPVFSGAGSWALGGVAPGLVREATVGLDLTLVPQLSANAVDALAGYKPAHRKSTFDVRFEGARIADYDVFTQWKTAPNNQLVINVGSAANNKMSITADKATIFDAPTFEDDSGLWLYRASGLLTPEGTNRVHISFGA